MGDNNLKWEHIAAPHSHSNECLHFGHQNYGNYGAHSHGQLNPSNYDWSRGGHLMCVIDEHAKEFKFIEVNNK
ncbi:MAG: hypothetical protein ACRCX7_11135 [Cetobacterium sp.]|uniref:hypothetical protein n=1 Tax=Cetobacterium sp. TaxID=2071632 RepID=UPI003F34F397